MLKLSYNKIKSFLPVTLMLILIWLIFVIIAPQTFLDKFIYTSFMSSIPPIAITAAGMTFVIICGEMDMSFTSNMAMSGFVFSVVTKATGSPTLGVVSALCLGATIGLINGLVIVGIEAPSIVVTIGFDFFWRGLVMLISNGIAISLSSMRNCFSFSFFTGRIAKLIPAQTIWAVLIFILLIIILHRTSFGDAVQFIGDNKTLAKMLGLPVSKVRIGVFMLMAITAAFSGVLSCMELGNWWPTQGEGYLLLVFASVFLGGTSVYGGQGTLWGTFVGAIVIGMIEGGLVSAGLSGFWTRFVHGVVLIGSVIFYSVVCKQKRKN